VKVIQHTCLTAQQDVILPVNVKSVKTSGKSRLDIESIPAEAFAMVLQKLAVTEKAANNETKMANENTDCNLVVKDKDVPLAAEKGESINQTKKKLCLQQQILPEGLIAEQLITESGRDKELNSTSLNNQVPDTKINMPIMTIKAEQKNLIKGEQNPAAESKAAISEEELLPEANKVINIKGKTRIQDILSYQHQTLDNPAKKLITSTADSQGQLINQRPAILSKSGSLLSGRKTLETTNSPFTPLRNVSAAEISARQVNSETNRISKDQSDSLTSKSSDGIALKNISTVLKIGQITVNEANNFSVLAQKSEGLAGKKAELTQKPGKIKKEDNIRLNFRADVAKTDNQETLNLKNNKNQALNNIGFKGKQETKEYDLPIRQNTRVDSAKGERRDNPSLTNEKSLSLNKIGFRENQELKGSDFATKLGAVGGDTAENQIKISVPGQYRESGEKISPTDKTQTISGKQDFHKNTELGSEHFLNQVNDMRSETVKPTVSSISNQILNNIRVMVNENKPSIMEVSLKPEFLGKIKIHLQSFEGLVSIKIVTDSFESAGLINSGLQHIKDTLEQQGVKVHNLTVDMSGNTVSFNNNSESFKQGAQQNHSPSKNLITSNNETGEESQQETITRPGTGLNLFA